MKTEVMNTLQNSGNIQGNAKTNNLSSCDLSQNLFSLLSGDSIFITEHPYNLYNYNNMNIKPSLEDKKPLLLNFDIPRIRRNSIVDSESEEKLPRCKSLFDSDEEEDVDTEVWINKPKELWNKTDTVCWLLWAGGKLGQTYGQMSPDFAMPGKDLLRLSKDDFRIRDPNYGERLYDLLHEECDTKSCLSYFDALTLVPDDDVTSPKSESKNSGGKSLKNSKDNNQTKRRGRPARLVPKKKMARQKLWEFIRDLLLDPEYCPKLICWENYKEKTFSFVKNREIAQLWGRRNDNKTNENMNYEKFARAIRYYYKKQIFEIVPGRRLVYKFGKKATGLETNCPNFDPNYCNDK